MIVLGTSWFRTTHPNRSWWREEMLHHQHLRVGQTPQCKQMPWLLRISTTLMGWSVPWNVLCDVNSKPDQPSTVRTMTKSSFGSIIEV